MAITHERRGILYLLAILAILAVVFVAMADGIDAKGRTKVKTSLSIRERVDIQTDNCEMAGGEISVSYAYEDDGSESATTSCSGGLLDGNICINEATTMECWQKSRVNLPLQGLDVTRPIVPITDVGVDQTTPIAGVPVGIDEELVPVDANGDIDGGGDAGNTSRPGDGSVRQDPVVNPEPVQPTSRDEVPMTVLIPLN